jgi:uncharacterized protein YdiU (UPF0061 family)
MEAFDPETVFSSIDHAGRYAYGNQPVIVQWNLARLAEALLPLLGDDRDAAIAAATEVLQSFTDRYDRYWRTGMQAKLGLIAGDPDDEVINGFQALLETQRVDHTLGFRTLSAAARGDWASAQALYAEPAAFDAWADRWLALPGERDADAMDRVNPLYIPRNHLVEAALDAATDGDLVPFERLLDVVTHPFDERPGLEAYTQPAPDDFGPYQTFCGT